jgi:hypothetical protein
MKSIRKAPVLTMALLSAAIAGVAHADTLSDSQIKKLVSGKRVYLATPLGMEFPLHYKANGSVSGDASKFTLASMLAPRETGKWWTKGKKLCQQWPSWYDGRTICFTVQQTGESTISWVRDDGYSGTARIAN